MTSEDRQRIQSENIPVYPVAPLFSTEIALYVFLAILSARNSVLSRTKQRALFSRECQPIPPLFSPSQFKKNLHSSRTLKYITF